MGTAYPVDCKPEHIYLHTEVTFIDWLDATPSKHFPCNSLEESSPSLLPHSVSKIDFRIRLTRRKRIQINRRRRGHGVPFLIAQLVLKHDYEKRHDDVLLEFREAHAHCPCSQYQQKLFKERRKGAYSMDASPPPSPNTRTAASCPRRARRCSGRGPIGSGLDRCWRLGACRSWGMPTLISPLSYKVVQVREEEGKRTT
jgi:hypothetical protein